MKSGERSWWYAGRRRIITDALAYTSLKKMQNALDFGAGYGAMHSLLSRYADRVYAYEPVPEIAQYVRTEGYAEVFETEVSALANSYGLIGIFDVLEHIEGDLEVLKSLYAATAVGGTIVITVPAGMLLWSMHDEQNKHFRRYSRRTLVKVVESTGFRVEFVSYWNTILYPLALAARLSGNSGESSFSLPPFIDSLFYACIALESWLMRRIRLPFGVSLVLVATKPSVSASPQS